jgi:hypothetical protein
MTRHRIAMKTGATLRRPNGAIIITTMEVQSQAVWQQGLLVE